MTREDYEELKRLYDHTRAIVVYRNPNTSKCFSIALSGAEAVTDADLSFLKDGEAVHIPTAIADYEREHKEDAKPDDVSQWPDWKKRAALCNYEFGKEDA